MTRDNIPLIAEERIMEQQTVEELREQITNLQNELAKEKGGGDKWANDISTIDGQKFLIYAKEEKLSSWEFNARNKIVFYINSGFFNSKKEPIHTFSEYGGRNIDDFKQATYEYYKNK